MALSRANPWGLRLIKDLKNYDQFAIEAKKIEDRFDKDTANLQVVKKKLA